MPDKRTVLDLLKRDELIAALERFDLTVADRRAKAELTHALATSKHAKLADILADLSRDRLKELCRQLDLDDSGRAKADLVARITGKPVAAHAAEPVTAEPALPAAASAGPTARLPATPAGGPEPAAPRAPAS